MATETTTGAVGSVHNGAETVGMPQLDLSTFPNQIFWLAVALGAVYFILDRVALPRIGSVLAERNGTITNDVAAAEDLKLKAQQAEAAYDKALADARAEAQKIAAATRAEVQVEIDAAIERAEADIAARSAEGQKRIAEIRDMALVNVETVAKDTVGTIVAAMGRSADAAEVNAAVEASMKGTAA